MGLIDQGESLYTMARLGGGKEGGRREGGRQKGIWRRGGGGVDSLKSDRESEQFHVDQFPISIFLTNHLARKFKKKVPLAG